MTNAEIRLREVLEQAMEDVALVMAEDDEHRASQAEKLLEVRKRVATVWKMAGFGDPPEFERETRVKRVG